MSDHIHLLIGLKPVHCLADVVRDLKKDATLWIRKISEEKGFSWQEGYAALSVSPSGLETVRAYVLNQQEHHRKRSFREELVEMLVKTGIPFDEKYLD